MRITDGGIALVKHFEGFRSEAYQCPGGVWTIGYGTTRGVSPGDTITREEAEARLRYELAEKASGVARILDRPTSPEKFSALVSFAYNVGFAGLRTSSVLAYHRLGRHEEAAQSFGLWVRAGGEVLRGLQLRRAAEAELYLSGDWKVQPITSLELERLQGLSQLDPIQAIQNPTGEAPWATPVDVRPSAPGGRGS